MKDKIIRFVYNIYVGYLLHTNSGRKKLLTSILTRKERKYPNCIACGECCKGCPAQEDKICKIWNEAQRVFSCHRYPMIPWVLRIDGVENKCRYYWDEEKIKT